MQLLLAAIFVLLTGLSSVKLTALWGAENSKCRTLKFSSPKLALLLLFLPHLLSAHTVGGKEKQVSALASLCMHCTYLLRLRALLIGVWVQNRFTTEPIQIWQKHYWLQVLKQYGMGDSFPVTTPADLGQVMDPATDEEVKEAKHG